MAKKVRSCLPLFREARFWQIIESSRDEARKIPRKKRSQDILDVHKQTLAAALRAISPDEIIGFNNRFWKVHLRAYRWNLWAAAYWLGGGCGDGGFTNFRACLISLGRERYEQVLQDPDCLVELVGQPDLPYLYGEGFQYVALKVYLETTGKDIPFPPAGRRQRPAGKRIDEEDAEVMRRHFPRLVAKFPKGGD